MRPYTPKKSYRGMTQEKADEIRRLYFSRAMSQKQLSLHFQLSQGSISRIISGLTWNA